METRECVVCKEVKPISEFNFHRRLTGERHIHCRGCQKIYKKNFYIRHREEYIQQSAREKQEKVKQNLERVRHYLRTHPCVDCGETDIVVLEFHHLGGKDRAVSTMVRTVTSWERIQKEIEKCLVLCGNCHRKRTARERGWNKFLGL